MLGCSPSDKKDIFKRETNIRETNILFSAIQIKILQQTKIPITIPDIHSINIL